MCNEKNIMNKFWLATILSLVAIVLGMIAIAVNYPSNNLNVDYIGVLFGVLSFGLTFLIGWNIYQLIDFREKENHLDERFKLMGKKYDDALKQAKKELRLENSCDLSINCSADFMERKMYKEALGCLVGGMKAATQLNNDIYINTICVNLSSLIERATSEGIELTLSDECKQILRMGVVNHASEFKVENMGSVKIDKEDLLDKIKLIKTV